METYRPFQAMPLSSAAASMGGILASEAIDAGKAALVPVAWVVAAILLIGTIVLDVALLPYRMMQKL